MLPQIINFSLPLNDEFDIPTERDEFPISYTRIHGGESKVYGVPLVFRRCILFYCDGFG